MRRGRIERLLDYDREAFATLGEPSWPFQHFISEKQNLGRDAGTLAMVRGIFRITLVLDPAILREPAWFRKFVIQHEVHHMRRRHGLKALLCLLLCFPMLPFQRFFFEWAADQAGAEGLNRRQVLLACEITRARTWWSRLWRPSPRARAEMACWGAE